MNELNKKYWLQMEVLTPLHVGAGAEKDWVQGSDFVVDDGKVKILNLKKIAEFVKIDDMTKAMLEKNSSSLVTKLAGNLNKCVDAVFDSNYFGTNDIKTCIKNGLSNQPIIPGSSLKGAIRSILLNKLHSKQEIINSKNNFGKWSEQPLFGSASVGDEFMRFIKVSDAEFEKTNLVNTKIFNLRSTSEGGWKHGGNTTSIFNTSGFNTFYEAIKPNEKSIMSLSIADVAFKNYADKISQFSPKKTKLINNNISFLFSIINAHTKKYLEKEKAFFTKYATDKTDKIIENIDYLVKQLPENGEYCILKMAAGSGFHNITGDWQFDDFSIDSIDGQRRNRGKIQGKEAAKSRKIAIQNGDQFSLMGFVKLRPISEQEIQQADEIRLQRQKEIENELKAQAELIAEQRRIEIKKQEELQQKQSFYKELILEATDLLQKGDFDAAASCVKKAEIKCPDEVSHFELKEQIEKAIAIRKQENDVLQAQQAIEQSRIASNKVALSEKIARNDKFGTIFGNLKTWMKLNEVTILQEVDVDALVSKLSELYSKMKPNEQKGWTEFKKWTDLSKVVGENVCKQISERVIQK
jgi:CRISPR/Cas system CSM-associated protein Csm5 (group 7 of RAMP superfamily)